MGAKFASPLDCISSAGSVLTMISGVTFAALSIDALSCFFSFSFIAAFNLFSDLGIDFSNFQGPDMALDEYHLLLPYK